MSSTYCAASATPTIGGTDFIVSFLNPSSGPLAAAFTPSSFSDPIGNRTDVSLYYTPSATGSAAWIVAMPTISGNSRSVSYSSVNTVSGQIVPTAVFSRSSPATTTAAPSGDAIDSASAASGSASTSASSSAGALETAIVRKKALAGMLGLAGLVALQ